MNYDEFAFFNQQLAAMLRDGIPLEGAIKQLSAGMRDRSLRAETEQLGAELAKGVPLKEALGNRSLPALYVRMLQIGVKSNDLPGTLTMLADHYHRANALWARLKGLMVYPLLVILVSVVLTPVLSLVFSTFMSNFFDPFGGMSPMSIASAWVPPLVLTLVALLGIAAVSIPAWRSWLRWRLPAFREASLAQLGSAIALMLRNGTPLAEALALAEALETATPAGKVLAQWRVSVENGQGKPAQWSGPTRPFPPLFLWLVRKGGEDAAAGFQKAAEIYHARASYRIEQALYGVLPVLVLFLGQMILWQVVPLMKVFISFMNMLGSTGDT